MLKEFKIGEKYKILKYEELKKVEGVKVRSDGSLDFPNEADSYYIGDMDNIKERVFIAKHSTLHEFNKYDIEPWMCVETDKELQTITIDEAIEIRKNGVMKGTFKNPTKEKVDHPSHYKRGGVEAIDVIEAWGLNFNLGNVVKYISRCGFKDDEMQELKKAKWYINREIERRCKNEKF